MGMILSIAHHFKTASIQEHSINPYILNELRKDTQQTVIGELQEMEECTTCYLNSRAEMLILSYLDCNYPWDMEDFDLLGYLQFLKENKPHVHSAICEHVQTSPPTLLKTLCKNKEKCKTQLKTVNKEKGECICSRENFKES